LLSRRDLVDVLGDKYAFALGTRCWFDDPLSLRVFCHLFFKRLSKRFYSTTIKMITAVRFFKICLFS
jgi:hypothetical protein